MPWQSADECAAHPLAEREGRDPGRLLRQMESSGLAGGAVFRDIVELSADQHAWLKQAEKKREELAQDAKDDAEDIPLTWGGPLRLAWAAAQRADPELAKEFTKTTARSGFRVDEDGVLAKRVEGGHTPETWVLVVPAGTFYS